MTRVKRGFVAKKKRKNILSLTKGFRGSHSKLFRTANQQLMKSLRYSFFDRRKKKNQYKSIWITRINILSRQLKTKYNTIISTLKKNAIIVNKKIFSELGKNEPFGFSEITFGELYKLPNCVEESIPEPDLFDLPSSVIFANGVPKRPKRF